MKLVTFSFPLVFCHGADRPRQSWCIVILNIKMRHSEDFSIWEAEGGKVILFGTKAGPLQETLPTSTLVQCALTAKCAERRNVHYFPWENETNIDSQIYGARSLFIYFCVEMNSETLCVRNGAEFFRKKQHFIFKNYIRHSSQRHSSKMWIDRLMTLYGDGQI